MKFFRSNRRAKGILVNFLITFMLLTVFVACLNWLQQSESKIGIIGWIIALYSSKLPLFDNIKALSVIAGVIIFVLDIPNQQKKSHYEAWQVIILSKGQSGSGGRIQALQDLAKDGLSLAGLSISNAYLAKIKLPGADLTEADLAGCKLKNSDFRRAKLIDAKLRRVNLEYANLSNADLSNADLSDADLVNTNFRNANLSGANFSGANLSNAKLNNTNLTKACFTNIYYPEPACVHYPESACEDMRNTNLNGTDLSGADLSDACLRNVEINFANLSGANLNNANLKYADLDHTKFWNKKLGEAKNITPEQIKQGRNWEKAEYSLEFRKLLGLPPKI